MVIPVQKPGAGMVGEYRVAYVARQNVERRRPAELHGIER